MGQIKPVFMGKWEKAFILTVKSLLHILWVQISGGGVMSKKIVILGTLDSKGKEFKYIKDTIEAQGIETILIDAGVYEAQITPDITNEEVAKASGNNLKDLRDAGDRGKAVTAMMNGAKKVLEELHEAGNVGGVISIGGSGGTTIASFAMKDLPVGLPKFIVSTVASGDTSPYVGVKDITMVYSIVDVAGLNNILKEILLNTSLAIAGIVKNKKELEKSHKPLIAATMFGVTTPCVTMAREYLESKGYEVVVFHATGSGGASMEGLIKSGYFSGVLDITTTEWADETVGGVFGAGQSRLDAAAKCGIPQVVSVGALDMVNFGAIETVPSQYKDRNLYVHNATVTLMRTTESENEVMAKIIADKVNQSSAKASFFIPLKGVSMIDAVDMPFYGPDENKVLFDSLRENINQNKIELIEMDNHINDSEFALAMAKKLVELMS